MLKLLLNACLEFCGTLCCSHLAGVPEEDKNKDIVKLKLLSEGGRLCTQGCGHCVSPLLCDSINTDSYAHCHTLLNAVTHPGASTKKVTVTRKQKFGLHFSTSLPPTVVTFVEPGQV